MTVINEAEHSSSLSAPEEIESNKKDDVDTKIVAGDKHTKATKKRKIRTSSSSSRLRRGLRLRKHSSESSLTSSSYYRARRKRRKRKRSSFSGQKRRSSRDKKNVNRRRRKRSRRKERHARSNRRRRSHSESSRPRSHSESGGDRISYTTISISLEKDLSRRSIDRAKRKRRRSNRKSRRRKGSRSNVKQSSQRRRYSNTRSSSREARYKREMESLYNSMCEESRYTSPPMRSEVKSISTTTTPWEKRPNGDEQEVNTTAKKTPTKDNKMICGSTAEPADFDGETPEAKTPKTPESMGMQPEGSKWLSPVNSTKELGKSQVIKNQMLTTKIAPIDGSTTILSPKAITHQRKTSEATVARRSLSSVSLIEQHRTTQITEDKKLILSVAPTNSYELSELDTCSFPMEAVTNKRRASALTEDRAILSIETPNDEQRTPQRTGAGNSCAIKIPTVESGTSQLSTGSKSVTPATPKSWSSWAKKSEVWRTFSPSALTDELRASESSEDSKFKTEEAENLHNERMSKRVMKRSRSRGYKRRRRWSRSRQRSKSADRSLSSQSDSDRRRKSGLFGSGFRTRRSRFSTSESSMRSSPPKADKSAERSAPEQSTDTNRKHNHLNVKDDHLVVNELIHQNVGKGFLPNIQS